MKTKPKGIIGVPRPQGTGVHWEFVNSLLSVAYFPIVSRSGALVNKNRNFLMEYASKTDAPFIIMIDTDMVFSASDVEAIAKHMDDGLDIVAGFCRRGSDRMPSVYKKIEECKGDYELFDGPLDGLTEVGAVGAAFLGISKKVIEKMHKDPFDFISVKGFWQGEDISFCHKARELGFKVWVDASIKIGHIRNTVIW